MSHTFKALKQAKVLKTTQAIDIEADFLSCFCVDPVECEYLPTNNNLSEMVLIDIAAIDLEAVVCIEGIYSI
jgi:hypothetical protein